MNKWGQSTDEDSETTAFSENITETTTAYDLLQLENFVEKVKNRSSKITKKYISIYFRIIEPKHRHILFQFVEIAINPKLFI